MKIHSDSRLSRPTPGRTLAIISLIALALLTVSCSGSAAGRSSRNAAAAGQPIAGILDAPASPTPTAVESPTPVPSPTITPTATPTVAPTVDYKKVKPNELGTIPILEYHIIGDEDGRWSRSYTSFREDLRKLYDAGFRPISINDLIDNRIDLPAGTSPVVLTFDDSSPGQFRFTEKDGQVVVDPNSAVGIMEEFHASHPDFPQRATFFVLPAADPPHNLFGQDEYQTQKLRHLVENGFDIGNHTYWHQRLDDVDDEEVQRQLGMAVKVIQQAVPDYRMRALALPLGLWPENRTLGTDGSFEGTTYHHDAILLVGSEPAPVPDRKDYDPLALPRVQVFEDNLDIWLDYLARTPDDRYVSDGDPNTIAFPRRLESRLNPASVETRTVRGY